MAKINKHIEIVRSFTTSLSSMGEQSCEMIQRVLKRHYRHVGVTIVNNSHDLDILAAKQPDLVFLGVKKVPVWGNPESSIWLSAYLDSVGLNYTGSSASAIGLDFNKDEAKRVIAAAGLCTAPYFMAKHGQYNSNDKLPLSFPMFIKPPSAGGGKGVDANSVVRDFATYEKKVQSVFDEFQTDALVEKYLVGREFSVAILEIINSKELIVMPIELIADQNSSGDRILGQQIKAADTEHTTAILDQTIKNIVIKLAIKSYRALGARDYGRIDIRLDHEGIPYFLEANLIPGLAFHDFISYFTRACSINLDMDYENMILHIVELGMSRGLSEIIYPKNPSPKNNPLKLTLEPELELA